MGSKKGPELPPTPTYQTDPIFKSGYENLSKYGNQLIAGDYSGFAGLDELTSLDPQSTNLALQAAQGFLNPQYQQSILDATNAAAANDTINSSTFTDALAKNALTLQSQYQGIGANAALQDRQRAMQNRLSLFGTGLDTLNQATSFGGQAQNSLNTFNLENYQNQVAKTLSEQKTPNSGFGALGTALGVGAGFLIGGPVGAGIGGAIGGGLGGATDSFRGASGTGGFNGMGASLGLLGSGLGGGGELPSLSSRLNSAPSAGFYAGNASAIGGNNALKNMFPFLN